MAGAYQGQLLRPFGISMSPTNCNWQHRKISFAAHVCRRAGVAAVLAAVLVSPSSMAQEYADSLGRLPDHVGKIMAWRHIPGVLLERCAEITPQHKSVMQHSFDAWRESNEDLISMIDRLVESTLPVFAKSAGLNVDDVRKDLQDGGKRLIIENYFGNPGSTPEGICSSYKEIVDNLSSLVTVTATRATAYAVKGDLLSRNIK